jgi:hypothetical protein
MASPATVWPAERLPGMREISGALVVIVVVFSALWAAGLIH